jgi:hypothetical protein
VLTESAVLDPQISYEGLKADCEDDPLMQQELDDKKQHLEDHYSTHYAYQIPSNHLSSQPSFMSTSSGLPQKVDFTLHFLVSATG